MPRVRLLERLNGPPRERGHGNAEAVRESVQAHVRKLLNTRRGNVPIDPEYGMPDLGRRLSGAQDSDLIEAVIGDVLGRYEPRLENVRIGHLGDAEDGLGLRLRIAGTIPHPERALPLRLDATLLADGRFLF